MPDAHPGPHACNGFAIATGSGIYPHWIGGDIGCGYTTVRLSGLNTLLTSPQLRRTTIDTLASAIPIIRSHTPTELPKSILPETLSAPNLETIARRDGRIQLGTLGRGNHFVELQLDDESQGWILIHSGSRAMGPAVLAHHLKSATRIASGIYRIDAQTPAFDAFRNDHDWCLRYASLNRAEILSRTILALSSISQSPVTPSSPVIDSPHNLLTQEVVGDRTLLIHRKSVTPAHHGTPVIVPGTIATPTYHAIGRATEESLFSCAHGAGRIMSRSQAQHRIRRDRAAQALADRLPSKTSIKDVLDECPEAYRPIEQVMRAQQDLITITRTLRPILTLKGN
jgi:tRNA-splicing ligase RtcB